MTTLPEFSDIDGQIIDEVEKWWKEHQSPLLLSLLGSFIDREKLDRAKSENTTLGNYIAHHLLDRVRVIYHSSKPSVAVVIPKEIEEDEGSLFERIPKAMHDRASAGPRFHPALWAAFRVPLDEPMARYISTKKPIRFFDAPFGESQPDHYREIGRKFVGTPDSTPDEMRKRVGQWLDENKLDATLFLADPKEKPTSFPSKDLLSHLLLSLDSDDLRRMSIPMDIVKKLRQKPL